MSKLGKRGASDVTSRKLAPGIAAFAAALLVALIGLVASADQPSGDGRDERGGVVELRLLGVNDLHGHLEPPRPGVGGVAWMAAHLDAQTVQGRTIRVHAGDMVGATPLLSSWFHDEPTIEAANALGFDVGTVGNHEFDEGGEELARLLGGGRRDGPDALRRDAGGELVNTSGPAYAGAAFPHLAANTLTADGEPLLAPYEIVERAGVRIGFIGVTTPSTPRFLLPRHAAGLRFADISDTVDRWTAELRRRGVEAIVVLAHAGAAPGPGGAGAAGEVVDEVAEMSSAVDVVIAGHSHTELNLRVPNANGAGDKLVVQARSYGIAFDRVDIAVDRATGDVVAKRAEIVSTAHETVTADSALAAHVRSYADRIAPLAERVVGSAERPLTRANGRLGTVAARAQRAFAGADVALVNRGSVRADLPAGPLREAALFAVHPYDFALVRMRLGGAELAALLAADRASGPDAQLHVAGPAGGIDRAAIYTVVANELAASSEDFPALRDAPRSGPPIGSETEALVSHFAAWRPPR